MKRFCLIIFLFVFGFQFSLAQDGSTFKEDSLEMLNKKGVKNVIYLELLGNSVGYSINYERRLDDHVWGRIGFSYFPAPFVEFVSMPLGISYLFGKAANFFETGLVITPAYADVDLFFDSEDKEKKFGVIISPTIGYRYQPKEKNLFFKIAFTPLLTTYETTFIPSGGISLGYSF